MPMLRNILLTSGTSNAMAALEKTGNNFLTDIRTLLVVAIAVSITYAGFRLLIGSKESKRAAKEDIPLHFGRRTPGRRSGCPGHLGCR